MNPQEAEIVELIRQAKKIAQDFMPARIDIVARLQKQMIDRAAGLKDKNEALDKGIEGLDLLVQWGRKLFGSGDGKRTFDSIEDFVQGYGVFENLTGEVINKAKAVGEWSDELTEVIEEFSDYCVQIKQFSERLSRGLSLGKEALMHQELTEQQQQPLREEHITHKPASGRSTTYKPPAAWKRNLIDRCKKLAERAVNAFRAAKRHLFKP